MNSSLLQGRLFFRAVNVHRRGYRKVSSSLNTYAPLQSLPGMATKVDPEGSKAALGATGSFPIVLLDIDGVLATLGHGGSDDATLVRRTCRSIQELPGSLAIQTIAFRPCVISRINEWATSGLAEPRWLSGWGSAAKAVFAPTVDAHPFPFADLSDGPVPAVLIKYDRSDNWEKETYLTAVYREDPSRPVVWIDDQCHFPTPAKHMRHAPDGILFEGPPGMRTLKRSQRSSIMYARRPGPTLIVKPLSEAGLLPVDVDVIEAFLRNPSELPVGALHMEDKSHWADLEGLQDAVDSLKRRSGAGSELADTAT